MIHSVNRNPSAADVRTFGITILCGLGVMGTLLWWGSGDEATGLSWTGRGAQITAIVLWAIGAVVAAVSFASRAAGKPIYVVWMTAAMGMGMVMVPVFLTVMYFVLLIPFTLIRLADPLGLKLKKDGTYWETHPRFEPTLERMSRLF